MKKVLILLVLPLFFGNMQAQKTKKQTIKFTQAWVWEYENNLIAENEPGHKGEIVVYFEPKQNYWLFTTEAFGNSGEMYNWIIGKPDGTYVLNASDEFGKTNLMIEKLKFSSNKKIPSHYRPLSNKKIFNENKLGFPKIIGRKYKVDYEKTTDQSAVYIGDYKVDFSPLYYFNRLIIESKIPLSFPFDLPENKLLLEDESINSNAKISLVFKEISNTEYFVEINDK